MLKSSGLSLTEVLICMLLLTILYSFGSNTLVSFLERNHLEMTVVDIQEAIRYAKIQALIQHQSVVLRPIEKDNDWSEGLILFIDNPAHQILDKTTILRQWHWTCHQSVSWHGFQSRQYLLFSPNLTEASVNGYFLIMGTKHVFKLIVNRLGRTRWSQSLRAS